MYIYIYIYIYVCIPGCLWTKLWISTHPRWWLTRCVFLSRVCVCVCVCVCVFLYRVCVCVRRTQHHLYGGLVSSSGGVSAAVGGLLVWLHHDVLWGLVLQRSWVHTPPPSSALILATDHTVEFTEVLLIPAINRLLLLLWVLCDLWTLFV